MLFRSRPDVRLGSSTPKADPSGDYTWEMFRKADALKPGAFVTLETKAQQLVGKVDSPKPPEGRLAYAWIMDKGDVDVFLTYCTNAVAAQQEVPRLRVVQLPAELQVGAAYGFTVRSAASPSAVAFGDALQRAEEALGQYEASADPTQLKFCRTHVHQVHGALAIVGLDGVALVTASTEALLAGMEEDRLPGGDASVAVLRQVLNALRQYLDDLMAAEPNLPLRLLPALQALATVRGLPAPHPCELFYPDLSLRPAKRVNDVPMLDSEQLLHALKAERMHFQKGLLSWLRKPAEAEIGRQVMCEAVAAIDAIQPTPVARTFWWVSLALLESLADPQLAADQTARQFCSRIDAQIRRLLEGSNNVAERVMREALYYIAQAPAGLHPRIDEVQSVYGLGDLLPTATAIAAPLPHQASLRKLRETLGAIEDEGMRAVVTPSIMSTPEIGRELALRTLAAVGINAG